MKKHIVKIQPFRILMLVIMTITAGVLTVSKTLATENYHECKKSASTQDLIIPVNPDLASDVVLKLCEQTQDKIQRISIASDLHTFVISRHNNELTKESIPIAQKNTNNIAQGSITPPKKQPLGWSNLDFSTPASPAAKVIGYLGDIGAISTPNELAVKLLNGLDSDGKFQTGFAIDIAPYLLARGTGFTLEEYVKPNAGFERFLANSKISIATGSRDATSRLGLGAEFILINEGDPRLDPKLLEDFQSIVDTLQPFDPTDPDYTAYNNSIKPKILAAKNRAKKRALDKPVWTLGVGTSLISTTGKYFDFRGDGTGAWTTFKTGLGGDSELILHGYYRSGARSEDRNVGFTNVDTLTTAARIRTGSENFKFSMETAYNFETQSGKASNSYFSFGLGVEPKITDKLWLSLSMSGSPGKQTGSDVQIFSGLKWNFNNGD
jgi:hypothetical protein